MHRLQNISRTCLTGLLLFTIPARVFCQSVNLDSLKQVWQDESVADTTRLDALLTFTKEGYETTQPDSAIYFSQLMFELAREKGIKKSMAQALNARGIAYFNKGDYDSAISSYDESLSINEEIGYKKGLASCHNNIGLVNEIQGDYVAAKKTISPVFGTA